MTEFQHCDIADEFTAEQAAALILGIDPANLNDTDRSKIKFVISCMQDCYRKAFNYYIKHYSHPIETITEENEGKTTILTLDPNPEWDFFQATAPKEKLYSISMQLALDADVSIKSWPNRKELTEFDNQKFSRRELDRWLHAIGLDSKYDFGNKPKQFTDEVEKKGHWPWGDHTTPLLADLESAALKFWAEYKGDPQKAPMNKKVTDWLQKNRGISEASAGAIAKILRGEKIPPGPKKNQ